MIFYKIFNIESYSQPSHQVLLASVDSSREAFGSPSSGAVSDPVVLVT